MPVWSVGIAAQRVKASGTPDKYGEQNLGCRPAKFLLALPCLEACRPQCSKSGRL